MKTLQKISNAVGATSSQLPAVAYPYFGLTFRRNDVIQLVGNLTPAIVTAIEAAIQNCWPGMEIFPLPLVKVRNKGKGLPFTPKTLHFIPLPLTYTLTLYPSPLLKK